MAAIRIYKRLQDQRDVDPNGLPDQGVPQYETSVSKFVVQTIAGGGGGGGSFSLGVSSLGNTLGLTGVTGTRLVLAGIGAITLSQSRDGNGGTISISGGGGGAGFSAGVSGGNTAGDTGATGTRLVLAGGQSITLSQATDLNGGTVTIQGASTAPQTVQTQNRFNLTLDGNTAGALAQVSSGTLTLAGGNGITLSQAGNAITISGSTFSQSVQPETQTFLGGISASDALYTSGTVRFTGVGGGVTVSSNTGQRVDISVAAPVAQTEQTQSRFNLTISGNTAGAGALISSGVLTLAGGNNITVSQAGNALTISGANAGGAQTGISGIANSQTTYTSGTVSLSELGAITIRSTTGNQFQLSVNPQSVQPETQTFIAGISASDTLYTSGNVRITGVGGGITVSSNTGQRVDLSVAPQSVQPGVQNLVVSDTTFSSGTVSISGFGAVTVNTAANIIRISAPVQTAQTGISGVANSQTTYTSGTVSLSELGAITIRSTTGNQYQFSVNAQTEQTQSRFNLTLGGNTAGVMALISSGVMTLAGGTNVTLSQAGNAVTISAGGGADTDVTSITQNAHGFAIGDWLRLNGTTYVKAQADTEANAEVVGVVSAVADVNTFTLTTGGLVTGLSGLTAGAVYFLSAATAGAITATEPTADGEISKPVFIARSTTSGYVFNMRGNVIGTAPLTAFLAGISNVGNTLGNTGITGSRLVLAGGNNITLSGSSNASGGTITISAFTQTVQTQNLHNVTLSGNTAGAMAQVSSGTMTLAGGNNITLSQAGNAITISGPNTAAQSAESQSIGMSNLGNTSGTTGIASGAQVRMLIVGGNNITLSQSLNGASGTITISAPNAVAQTDQTLGMYAVGNTTGQSSSTTRDARSVSFEGAGIVSLGYSAGSLRISATQTPQTVQSLGMYAVQNTTGQSSSTTMDARTLSIAGDGAVSVGYSAGSLRISAPVQSVQPGVQHLVVSNTTFSSGTVSISGFGDVTVNTAANIIRISAPVQTAETAISGIANSQTTYTSGTVSLSELGAITIRSTTGNQFQLSVNAQTGTQFSAGLSNIGNTLGDTATVGGRLILAGIGQVTLSGSTNGVSQTISISAPVQSAESQSIGMSNVGNTSGTTGMASAAQVRFVFAGGNNITLSQSLDGASGTITISAPNLGAGAMSVGASNLGNTAGATGITGTQLVLVGSDNITLSQTTGANGGTVSIIGPAGFVAGVSTGGNTAGATGVTGTRMVWVGSSPISLSQTTGAAGGTITINAPATSSLVGVSGISISTNGSTISIMQTTGSGFLTSLSPYDESPLVTGHQGLGSLHLSPVRIPDELRFDRLGLGMQISQATNSSGTLTISNLVGLYTRNVSTLSLLMSTSITTQFTGSGTAGSYSLYGGPRWHTIPWTTTLTGGDYVIGIINRTATGGAAHGVSQLLLSKFTNVAWSGLIGAGSNATDQRLLGQGHYSATTASLPATIPFTAIRGTESIVLRTPIFMFRSGTV